MLYSAYLNLSSRFSYIDLLVIWNVTLDSSLNFVIFGDPSLLLKWYILLDDTIPMLIPFIVLLSFDEAAECMTTIFFSLLSFKVVEEECQCPYFL